MRESKQTKEVEVAWAAVHCLMRRRKAARDPDWRTLFCGQSPPASGRYLEAWRRASQNLSAVAFTDEARRWRR